MNIFDEFLEEAENDCLFENIEKKYQNLVSINNLLKFFHDL